MMLSELQAEERRLLAEASRRKHATVEHANATEAQAELAATGQASLRNLPSGVMIQLQDGMGNVLPQAGLHFPVREAGASYK